MQTARVQSINNGPSSAQAVPAIRLDGLEKRYLTRDGKRIQAMGPITLDIPQGEFLTVVGPSGCGKSTLLRMLAGLTEKSVGDIAVRGRSVSGPQADIGMVFQSPVLLPWKTSLANVMLPADVLGLDKTAAEQRARELLVMVGLGDFQDKYPNELSGGMQQRVAIARALLHEPSILLMDEPFGALDAMTRETMNEELRRIWRESGKTIVFVTHSIPEAVFLGSRVLVLSERPGRIADLIDVNLPEDRDLDSMGSDRFGAITRRIRTLFNARGGLE